MKNHTLIRPGRDHNPEPAETPQHERRFDERGIALQTIIIMVVLLAIAGAVAAVLFNRAETETTRLENSEDTFVYAIDSDLQCRTLGHTWSTTAADADADVLAGLTAAGRSFANATAAAAAGFCIPQ